MADAVASQTILDGPRKVVMKFTNSSDGTGEAAVLKVDVSALETHAGKTCTGVVIDKVIYSTVGMAVTLLWDATADVRILDIAQDMSGELCFSPALPNNAGAGKTGDILLTTTGHTAGDAYTVILEMSKQYA